MRNKLIRGVTFVLAMVGIFLLWASNALGQDMMRAGGCKDGYGAYGTMGQNPDEILNTAGI